MNFNDNNDNDIDPVISNQELIQSAHQAIRMVLVAHGHIEVPKLELTYDDQQQQSAYELFIAASAKHLEYLMNEGFVSLDGDKYVLRSQDDLESEVSMLLER